MNMPEAWVDIEEQLHNLIPILLAVQIYCSFPLGERYLFRKFQQVVDLSKKVRIPPLLNKLINCYGDLITNRGKCKVATGIHAVISLISHGDLDHFMRVSRLMPTLANRCKGMRSPDYEYISM